ncbi:hypothetical protein [uncultured Algibacter sp.]|uniref:hypothetical protein n=1 Tax=uncultured Algibacter sp. TaxID=298659 RepID=UPI002621A9A7|nr:hypothetical protein [uncultured Algibacter sp.]
MKYFNIIFFSLILLSSCSKPEATEIEEEKTARDSRAPIVPGYKILKIEETSYYFPGHLSSNAPTTSDIIIKRAKTITFEYNGDNTIKEYFEYSKHEEYDFDDGTIGPTVNNTRVHTNKYDFHYDQNRISHIDRFSTQVNNKARIPAIIEFTYFDDGKLKTYVHKRIRPSYVIRAFSLDWSNDRKIIFNPILTTDSASWKKGDYLLDENGDFLSYIGPGTFFDDKNNPYDLVYPKYLLGYRQFGSGNNLQPVEIEKINKPEECNCEYTYNEYDFPITYTKRFTNGKPNYEIKYTYGF